MKVKFIPEGGEFEITPDKSVLQLAHENGIPIRSVCKGVPSCAECRVRIVEGENNVLPPTKAEINLVGSTYYVDQRRLACQLRCFGDVVVDVAPHLNREDSPSKRLRGVKQTSLPKETRARQGTMVLEESTPEVEDKREASAQSGSADGNSGPRSKKKSRKRNNRRRRKPQANKDSSTN